MERLIILIFYVGYLLTPSEVLDIFHCLQRRYLYTFDNQINKMHIDKKIYNYKYVFIWWYLVIVPLWLVAHTVGDAIGEISCSCN